MCSFFERHGDAARFYWHIKCQLHFKNSIKLQSLELMQELSTAQNEFFRVCTVARLILIMPATNAVSECSFSAIRRLMTYLRSTTCQCRLNHVMLLNINQECLD